MTTPNDTDSQGSSTRPYLIRALHDWCTDNGFTPYLAVYVDGSVRVPQEYVKNNEIVLNVSFEATSQLELGNEFVEFKARFGGVAREISVPMDHVIAIYARENGQGMAFPVPASPGDPNAEPQSHASHESGSDSAGDQATPLRLARAPRAVPAKDGKEKGSSLKGAFKGDEKAAPPKAPSPMSIVTSDGDEPPDAPPPAGGHRPALRRVK